MPDQKISNVDQGKSEAEFALVQLQLERTREVNSALWARINNGSVSRSEDGNVSVPTPKQRLNSLESENQVLRERCKHLEQTLAEVQHTNGELWKRVDHAERSTAYQTRRKIGALLRKAGLR